MPEVPRQDGGGLPAVAEADPARATVGTVLCRSLDHEAAEALAHGHDGPGPHRSHGATTEAAAGASHAAAQAGRGHDGAIPAVAPAPPGGARTVTASLVGSALLGREHPVPGAGLDLQARTTAAHDALRQNP